jgi:hypothetical protein
LLIAAVCWSIPAFSVVQVVSGGISVSVEETGRFEVTTHNPAWKFSGSVGAPLADLAAGMGRDRVDAYREVAFQYSASEGGARHGAIRVCRHRPVLIFALAF